MKQLPVGVGVAGMLAALALLFPLGCGSTEMPIPPGGPDPNIAYCSTAIFEDPSWGGTEGGHPWTGERLTSETFVFGRMALVALLAAAVPLTAGLAVNRWLQRRRKANGIDASRSPKSSGGDHGAHRFTVRIARKPERITLPPSLRFSCAFPGEHSARRLRIDKQEVAGSIPARPTPREAARWQRSMADHSACLHRALRNSSTDTSAWRRIDLKVPRASSSWSGTIAVRPSSLRSFTWLLRWLTCWNPNLRSALMARCPETIGSPSVTR
jgi:hypothetical protein